MIRRAIPMLTILSCAAQSLAAQRNVVRAYDAVAAPSARSTVTHSASFVHVLPHYGKWLTAGATAGLTYLGAREHTKSRRDWDALLAICRSAQDACTIGSDGRYISADAELLYQTSRFFDRRANRRLLGAQVSLLATAALFIIDLRQGHQGPENIPFSPLRVGVRPTIDGADVEMRIAF